jgi:hypothetical protein
MFSAIDLASFYPGANDFFIAGSAGPSTVGSSGTARALSFFCWAANSFLTAFTLLSGFAPGLSAFAQTSRNFNSASVTPAMNQEWGRRLERQI